MLKTTRESSGEEVGRFVEDMGMKFSLERRSSDTIKSIKILRSLQCNSQHNIIDAQPIIIYRGLQRLHILLRKDYSNQKLFMDRIFVLIHKHDCRLGAVSQ
jgi:hypothetical protein